MNLIARIALLTALSGCGATSKAAPQTTTADADPCADAESSTKRFWNESIKLQVEAQILEWKGTLGGQVARQKASEVTSSMDRITDDWARMRRSVCRDYTIRQSLGAGAYQRRVDCLDRLLSRQRTFVESLAQPSPDVSAQLASLNDELDACR
jgi:hypothetical protein